MKVLADRSSVDSIMDSDGLDSEVTGCAMVETDSLAGSLAMVETDSLAGSLKSV
jgi:hypothetical protein